MTGIGKQITCFEVLCVQAVFALTFPPNYAEPLAWTNDSIVQLCGKVLFSRNDQLLGPGEFF
jgi:hypothetical protein